MDPFLKIPLFLLKMGIIPASYVRVPGCLGGKRISSLQAFNLQDFANEIRQNLSSLEIGEEIRQSRNRFF